MMNILVCFKVVPDWDRVLEEDWDELAATSDLSYAGLELNCFDESALELALQLKDDLSSEGKQATCTAVTANALHSSFAQTLYAVGFDDVVTLGAEYTEFDPSNTAKMLAEYINAGCYDIILTGYMAGMADSGMVPYYIAANQNISIVSEVENLRWKDEGLAAYSREEDGLWERGVQTPCVVSVSNSPSVLRAVTLREKLKMRDKQATSIADDSGAKRLPKGLYKKRVFDRTCEKIEEDTAEAIAATLHKQLSSGHAGQQKAEQTTEVKLPQATVYCPLDDIAPFAVFSQLQAIANDIKKQAPDLLLLPDTKLGRELAVRLAEREQVPAMTNVSLKMIDDKLFMQKSVCASNLAWTQEVPVPAILTIAEKPKHVPSMLLNMNDDSSACIRYEKQVEKSTASAVYNDEMVVVCGAGMGNKENCDLARKLAKKLRAGFGLTRQAAVSGWGGTSEIIGQSGAEVSPKVCLVLGASGASAFTVGIEHAQRIYAINTDDHALIFKQADVGVVADATEIVKELLLLV